MPEFISHSHRLPIFMKMNLLPINSWTQLQNSSVSCYKSLWRGCNRCISHPDLYPDCDDDWPATWLKYYAQSVHDFWRKSIHKSIPTAYTPFPFLVDHRHLRLCRLKWTYPWCPWLSCDPGASSVRVKLGLAAKIAVQLIWAPDSHRRAHTTIVPLATL